MTQTAHNTASVGPTREVDLGPLVWALHRARGVIQAFDLRVAHEVSVVYRPWLPLRDRLAMRAES